MRRRATATRPARASIAASARSALEGAAATSRTRARRARLGRGPNDGRGREGSDEVGERLAEEGLHTLKDLSEETAAEPAAHKRLPRAK